jgi:hypothetical protein
MLAWATVHSLGAGKVSACLRHRRGNDLLGAADIDLGSALEIPIPSLFGSEVGRVAEPVPAQQLVDPVWKEFEGRLSKTSGDPNCRGPFENR